MKRRTLLRKSAALGTSVLAYHSLATALQTASSPTISNELPIPDVMDVSGQARGKMTAATATHAFAPDIESPTLGYSQSYLGPVIRVKRGFTARVAITNKTQSPITTHWHGLHVEGEVDGGPQTAFPPGETWSPDLDIDQPAATLWYHSHVHGKTGEQVYAGLAGLMIVEDPTAPATGLPETYGLDDIPLIVQDRAFSGDGTLHYSNRGPALMHGFRAKEILVNGVIRPQASVPAGLIRFRVLNASNARIYTFSFEDDRTFHQVASDSGLLPRPIEMRSIQLAPAERAEIVVDFTNGRAVRLLSIEDSNNPMRGMMGGGMMGRGMMGGGMMGPMGGSPEFATSDRRFEIMRFGVDLDKPINLTELPTQIAGAPMLPDWGKLARRRDFSLDMGMGMMSGGRMRGERNTMMGMGAMGINGKTMSMDRIDVQARRGETEVWRIISNQMAHPFHIHGTSFQVLSLNGQSQPFDKLGLKDVVLVDGEAELLVHFTRKANSRFPYMFHCHILEHEDAGMMGQFTVA